MSEEREPLDATPQGSSPSEDFGTARAHRRRSEQHNWRRWAWWALIIATVGFGWALVLATVFIVRSGDRLWDPVVATHRLAPSLLLILLLALGFEFLRRQVIREFPDRVTTKSGDGFAQRIADRITP